MTIGHIINTVYVAFAILGAADYTLGNRLGLGAEFERGIGCAGKLIICMTGFMALAPVIGETLTPLVEPIFVPMGADPSAVAGLLLANDSGGASIATAMASNLEAGLFNGYLVASMMGAAVMCLIPMCILNSDAYCRTAIIYGLVIGLFSVPFGCAVGGLAAGFSKAVIICNLIPVTVVSLGLFLALFFLSSLMIRPFYLVGKLLVAVSLTGLLLAMINEMFGCAIVDKMEPLSKIMPVIGNIALILGGVFPMLKVVTRLLRKPLAQGAVVLNINEADMSSLLITLVNIFPVFGRLRTMSSKGAMLNCAFMVGANCVLGDHFAFTSQVQPNLVGPMIIGKFLSGGLALLLANMLAPRLLGIQKIEESNSKEF